MDNTTIDPQATSLAGPTADLRKAMPHLWRGADEFLATDNPPLDHVRAVYAHCSFCDECSIPDGFPDCPSADEVEIWEWEHNRPAWTPGEYTPEEVYEYLAARTLEPDPDEIRVERQYAALDALRTKIARYVNGNAEPPIPVPHKKGGPYREPTRRDDEYCLNTKFRIRRRSDGVVVKTPFPCRECGPCLRYWQRRKMHRHDWEIVERHDWKPADAPPLQTVVIVRGCETDDAAGRAAIGVGRTGQASRTVCLVPKMGSWTALVVFHGVLDENTIRNIRRTRERHGQECEIETRIFAGQSLLEWLPTDRLTPSKRKPCRIVAEDDRDKPEREYAYNDGVVVGADDPRLRDLPSDADAPTDDELLPLHDVPTDTPAEKRAKLDRRNLKHAMRWLDGVELHRQSLLAMRTARLDGRKDNWFACIASGAYRGPRAMLFDLVLALDPAGNLPAECPEWMRHAAGRIVEVKADPAPVSLLPDDMPDC